MSTQINNVRIALRHDTLEKWTQSNPLLLQGEYAAAVLPDSSVRIKIGDGEHTFNELPYEGQYLSAGEGLNLDNGEFSVDTSVIATREYVDNSVPSLSDYYTKDESNQIMASVVASGRDYTDSHIESVLSDYYLKNETSSSTELSDAFSKCSNVTLISGDAPFASDLSVVKINNDDYNKLVVDGAINESALYVITDDYTSFRGQQIKNVAEPTDDNDAVTKNYVDSNVSYITSELTGFGKTISYDTSVKKIYLKNGTSILGTVDCTDFIKDGMISSVSYDESTHIIHIVWNTDAGSKTTDINLSGLIDTYTAGEGLNLVNGQFSVDTSIIATREYVDNSVPSLSDYYTKDESNQIMASVVASGRDYTDSHVESVISDYYSKNETSSSTELSDAFAKCSNVSLISGDTPFASDLSVVKITNDDYAKLIIDQNINESALYVITDDYTSFRGQPVKDVATPVDDNDAATKKYVDDAVSEIDVSELNRLIAKNTTNIAKNADNIATLTTRVTTVEAQLASMDHLTIGNTTINESQLQQLLALLNSANNILNQSF